MMGGANSRAILKSQAVAGVALALGLAVGMVVSTPLAALASPDRLAGAEAAPALPGRATETPAAPSSAGQSEQPAIRARITYLGKIYPEPAPLSLLDKVLTDEGVQGARVALKENNMTGRLIGQHHELAEHRIAMGDDIVEKAKALFADGHTLIIADLEADDLLEVADLPEAAGAILLNIRLSDDELRQEACRSNVFHLAPSWSMRADALAQYLVWKKWNRWFLLSGKGLKDQQYAAAIRRSAKKFGGKIVDEKTYAFEAGSRRTDSGHQQIQTQMPQLTETAEDYHVVFAADAEESFGDYLLFRTRDPRPVVGSHGLTAVGWHRSFEQYAGTQMQNRFERAAHRWMTERDYYAWLAVRVFGEAVLRTSSTQPDTLKTYLLSKDFEVAGFKGLGMTFRNWDRQLRQPILLSGPRALVSISPQDGFLHQYFQTDTLGSDQPESRCRPAK
ncbi:MAG: ABC transporter substrate-binding protein [Hyphomicrobium sp.]